MAPYIVLRTKPYFRPSAKLLMDVKQDFAKLLVVTNCPLNVLLIIIFLFLTYLTITANFSDMC